MIVRVAATACEGDGDFRVNAFAALALEISSGCEGNSIDAFGCIAGEIAAAAVGVGNTVGNSEPRGALLLLEANGNRGGGLAQNSVEDMC